MFENDKLLHHPTDEEFADEVWGDEAPTAGGTAHEPYVPTEIIEPEEPSGE